MKAIHIFVSAMIIVSFSIAKKGVASQNLNQNYRLKETQGDYYDSTRAKYHETSQKLAEAAASRKANSLPTQRLNVTAWGIIGIIIGIIILSTISYYAFTLYPYICKKKQTYNIIELTDVNSVCTGSDSANLPLYRRSNDVSVNC